MDEAGDSFIAFRAGAYTFLFPLTALVVILPKGEQRSFPTAYAWTGKMVEYQDVIYPICDLSEKLGGKACLGHCLAMLELEGELVVIATDEPGSNLVISREIFQTAQEEADGAYKKLIVAGEELILPTRKMFRGNP